jgi:hypothetical protein
MQNKKTTNNIGMMDKGHQQEHWGKCITLQKLTPPEEWPHHFIHTLERIQANWHTDQELCKGTGTWMILQQNFSLTFSFEHENPNIDATLKRIKGVILITKPEVKLIT